MADVANAFFRGSEFARSEAEHEQNLQHSKLQQQVLKHELGRLKLEDELQKFTLAQKRADMGLGQEDGNTPAPSEVATATQQGGSLADALMKKSLAGFGTGTTPAPTRTPILTPGGGGSSAAADATVPPMQAAGRIVAPVDLSGGHAPLVLHHADPMPPTHDEVPAGTMPTDYGRPTSLPMRKNGYTWLPPIQVPEQGIDVPGMWYSPRAAVEEQQRRAIALKRAEQPLHNVPPQNVAVDGEGKPVFTNNAVAGNTPQEQYIAALRSGNTATARLILQGIKDSRPAGREDLGHMLLDARTRGDAAEARLITSVLAEEASARRDPNAAADRTAARADREANSAFTNDMRLYTADVANGWKAHADALKEYNDPLKHPENLVPETAKEPPTYEPPSFEAWRASHGGAGAAAATGTGKAPGGAAAAAGKAAGKKAASLADAAKVLKGQQPGKYTLTDGSVWRVKPDGTVAVEGAAK